MSVETEILSSFFQMRGVGRRWNIFPYVRMTLSVADSSFNPWSPGGSFMVQKIVITPPIPSFQGLKTITRVLE